MYSQEGHSNVFHCCYNLQTATEEECFTATQGDVSPPN